MPTKPENTPHRGSHFSGRGENPASGRPQRPTGRHGAPGPFAPTGARAPRPADGRGRVSARSTAVTRRTVAGGSSRRPQGRRPQERVLLAAAGAGVVLAVAALVFFVVIPLISGSQASRRPDVAAGHEVTVTIADGSSTVEIARTLFDAGIISDKDSFLQDVKKRGVEQQLKSGTYALLTGSSDDNVINQLIEGPNSSAGSLVVPEGYTVSQVASLVEKTYGVPAADFTAQAKASNYVADFPFLSEAADDSLEGFLFPKTYDFSGKSVSADLVIRAMLKQYQAEVSELNLPEAEARLKERYGVTMSDYDILKMASIIEKEALTDDDRAKIASVFYNRLSAKMPLQSDATLAYSLGREAKAEDLTQSDPYNSYLNGGLTPTPICNPGKASLLAAINPADTKYFYFFITSKIHAFSETYEEHQQVIAENS